MKKEKIVFFGTPEFAVESLQELVEREYNVVGVVTVPDLPTRKNKEGYSPVKQYAMTKSIPILQPTNFKDSDFLEDLKWLGGDIFVVVAFKMLPEEVWGMPRLGTFNLHASLLPQYRGAAPINWAIMNGESVTGVTTFFIDSGMDTGDIILQERVVITLIDNFLSLHDRLKEVGADLVCKTIDLIVSGKVKKKLIITPDNMFLMKAPKLTREFCKIDWSRNTEEIYNFIRGLSPYPGAWTEVTLQGGKKKVMKILSSFRVYYQPLRDKVNFMTDGKSYIRFKTGDGHIDVKGLQIEGGKVMSVEEFLLGNKLEA